jgi:hypothetical protein
VYFVCAEALTNVAKYACASLVRIELHRDAGRIVVQMVDDGVGGADPGRGSGLRGLADRVEALAGGSACTALRERALGSSSRSRQSERAPAGQPARPLGIIALRIRARCRFAATAWRAWAGARPCPGRARM